MWYLTCNLGRDEDDDLVLDNEPVLTIKVKYITLPVNGNRTPPDYIEFDRTPSPTIADTFGIIDARNRYRGRALNLTQLMNSLLQEICCQLEVIEILLFQVVFSVVLEILMVLIH
jgi:hypothetical protein